jgi:hypothetical protein
MPYRVRLTVLAAVFGVQLAGIGYARFVPTRYLCWAPYDQISFYVIEAERDGRPLTPGDIAARYRMPADGRENRAIQHVLDTIAQYESTYGRVERVEVRVRYRTNGRPEQTWTPPR